VSADVGRHVDEQVILAENMQLKRHALELVQARGYVAREAGFPTTHQHPRTLSQSTTTGPGTRQMPICHLFNAARDATGARFDNGCAQI
jgi:hypothetical protein